jgi:nicotinamide-nucleotide amidase
MIRAEILSIGTELTSGQNLDTNSQWLSQRLADIGIAVGWHTTVADDFDSNVEAFQIAARRADLVLATGGLGPTQDDLTRDVLAKVSGVDLFLHEPSLTHIRELFESRRRVMPERNQVQAMFPKGSLPIHNAKGTAPGIWLALGNATVVALPGVPSEMHAMYFAEVQPRLLTMGLSGGVRVQRKINTFGAGESQVEEKLFDLTRRGHVPEVGITASDAVISLRIFAQARTLAEAQKQIAPVEDTIRQRLGDLVFGVDDESLQDVVLWLLAEKRLTLGAAESVTGGLVANRLAQVPGASDWFKGGVVAYTNPIKTALLGVPASLIEQHTAVSGPVAEAMAIGARERLGVDLAVSTTGYAGPSGDPVGLVYVGLATASGVSSVSFHWFGNRTEVQSRAAKMALNRVRLHLMRCGDE